ncbi:F-actin monooxygenase [Aphelenchoides bicaudatus]|nr:F-actin monooxygenase [Aphelenchoides bicaudatus]
MENLFEIFLREWTLPGVQQAFYQLCINRGVNPADYQNIYEKLKQADRFCDSSFKQKQLWDLLDKRRDQKVYQNQTVCRGMNVLIVGAGPCGLRAAIECALLGAQVIVVDSRDKFTRNNVLHLWKFVIEDLRGLGAKLFFPKFCTGSIEHIAIRRLQFILLKVALVLGVQFYDKLQYKDLKEPQDGKGWRAIFEPSDHILNDFEFDVIIGASGKQKCLPAFKHNPVRGKLAIGITANFVRHRNKEEDSVPEIQGVAYVYRQDYFDDLERKTKIQLENIVYYKGDSHYFVMCGKKQNLISKGVIKSDKENVKALLAKDNVDTEALQKYVVQVVDYVTDGKLGQLEFSLNGSKKPDVAAFDFTTLESADHSTRYVRYMDHSLILSLVGDYLHEPFWPTGSGCARGFLSVMDTAWLLRNVGIGKEPMAKLLAEREGVYSLLSQTQPNNLSTAYHSYTIDPCKRYTRFKPTLPAVDHLMGTDNDEEDLAEILMKINRQSSSNAEFLERCSLFRFCYMSALSKKIRISSFRRSSWADGCALAAMISKYNLDFSTSVPITSPCNPSTLCLESFAYAEKHLGIPQPCKTQYEWAVMRESDRIDYLEKLVEVLRANPYYAQSCMSPTLLNNFNKEKALASAIQARILRPKQYMQTANPTFDPVFNFPALEDAENITVRAKRPKLDGTLKALDTLVNTARRSSIEPLNPELIFKIDKIASGNYARGGQSDQFRAASKLVPKRNEPQQKVKSSPPQQKETKKSDTKLTQPTQLNESITRGSLAGVKTVSKFRHQFDNKNNSTRQRTSSIKSNTDSTASSLTSQLSQSDTSSTEDDHPTDPMHTTQKVGSLPSNGLSYQPQTHKSSNANNEVVYRSTTHQHQFVASRRPISVPNMLPSPELHKTFGQRKPTQPVNTAQQQVYKTVSQRRMKLCALCNNEVYLAEQKIVDDRLCVHKQCFRCAYCNRILELGKAFVDRSFIDKFGVRWYCAQHNSKSADDKLQQLMRAANKQKNSTAVVAIVSPTKLTTQKQCSIELPPPKPSYPERTYVDSSAQSSTSSSLNELIEISQPYKGPSILAKGTTLRLVSLGLDKITIEEDKELETNPDTTIKCQQSEHSSSSDQENDRQSSEGFEEDQYFIEDEEEFVDAGQESEGENDSDPIIDQDAWDELKSYLENSLIDSQLMTQFCESTSEQARNLIETFNKRSLLNHFSNQPATPLPPTQRQQQIEQNTPYFTPRQDRAETLPNAEANQDFFFTPRTTLRAPALVRRSSTLDRKTQVESGQLKPRIQQAVVYAESSTKMNGIDHATPHRAQRQRMRRGPRRATVAIDLKRESLAPDDVVANKNLTEQQKADLQETLTTTTNKIRRSPSVQQRRRALHIRPTTENLDRVMREIEQIKKRHEVTERISQIYKVGNYLEKSLQKDPRQLWELEQWLIYSQQFEELQTELETLKLEVKILHLDDQYQHLKLKLHAQQDATLTDNQTDSEKRIMQRLLELLNEKDSQKALLHEIQTDIRPKTPPAELLKRAPSYTCYSAVFLSNESKYTLSALNNKPTQFNDRIPV